MSIIDEYISQQISERLKLDIDDDDITWQLGGHVSDYVNTRILFTREKPALTVTRQHYRAAGRY